MSPEELAAKLEDISRILSDHNIEFGFANDPPDRVLYEYLPGECIAGERVSRSVEGIRLDCWK